MWFKVEEIKPNLFHVEEPEHVSFFIFKNHERALFIDTGLGLVESVFKSELLERYDIKSFDVLATHAHCDHAGFNSLADKVFISEVEWKKYNQLGEINQIDWYYNALKDQIEWPNSLNKKPIQLKWKPTSFISDNQVFEWGSLKFKCLHLPGHTKGSYVFHETISDVLLLGDFLYNGTLYIHLEDSSIVDFLLSLKRLKEYLKARNPILLPCHNSIPLDRDYFDRLDEALQLIALEKLRPKEVWQQDEIFSLAVIFEFKDVRIAIKKNEIDIFKNHFCNNLQL